MARLHHSEIIQLGENKCNSKGKKCAHIAVSSGRIKIINQVLSCEINFVLKTKELHYVQHEKKKKNTQKRT